MPTFSFLLPTASPCLISLSLLTPSPCQSCMQPIFLSCFFWPSKNETDQMCTGQGIVGSRTSNLASFSKKSSKHVGSGSQCYACACTEGRRRRNQEGPCQRRKCQVGPHVCGRMPIGGEIVELRASSLIFAGHGQPRCPCRWIVPPPPGRSDRHIPIQRRLKGSSTRLIAGPAQPHPP